MPLREYQEKGVIALSRMIASGIHRVVLQCATGGGKTVMFSAICERYTKKGGRVLILVHRKELMNQTRRTLYEMYGIVAECVTAGTRYLPRVSVYIGMVESVKNRMHLLPDIGMVIVDEAHLAIHNKMLDKFPSAYIIGFTATPLSANKKEPMNKYYSDIVCCVDIPELIKLGSLCQNITYAPKDVVERAALAIKGGDFNEGQMGEAFSKPRYVNNTVSAYQRFSPNTKAIVFNVTIEHSLLVTQAFVAAGLPARHLDGACDSYLRQHTLNWFNTTPNAILCNVGVLTAGFDEPSIETVIMNRSTMSMPLWLQCTGRGSRPHEGKHSFTIIDLGGNAVTHGDWCDPRDWVSIFNNPPKPGEGGVGPVKNCPNCDAIIPASSGLCVHCDYVFPVKEREPESDLDKFIVVTKGIDVEQLIEKSRYRKEYYPFFQIGEQLAKDAKKTIPHMDDFKAEQILTRYYELAKEWCKSASLTRSKEREKIQTSIQKFHTVPNEKTAELQKQLTQLNPINFSPWHKEKAKETLYNALQKYYKTWKPLSASTPVSV